MQDKKFARLSQGPEQSAMAVEWTRRKRESELSRLNIRGVVPVVFVVVFGPYGQTRLSKKCILAIRCARSPLVTDPVRSERPVARAP